MVRVIWGAGGSSWAPSAGLGSMPGPACAKATSELAAANGVGHNVANSSAHLSRRPRIWVASRLDVSLQTNGN